MGDPSTDPRAAWLLAAQPGEVGALASAFHTVASQAQSAAAALRGARGDATWTGQAADAFRTQLGKLPGDLDNVQRSYQEVAGALDTYEGQLGPIRSQFQQVISQIEGVQGSLTSAQGQLTSAQGNLTTATNAPHAKLTSPAVVDAHTAVQSAGAQVGRLQGELTGLEGRGYGLLDEFDTVRGRARSTVSGAAGIAPSESWLAGALSAVGNFLVGVGEGIGKSVWDLISGHAIENFIEHPGWASLGELVKDIAVTASIVAMIAAPFAAPELLEADGAVLSEDALLEGAEAGAEAGAEGAEEGAESGMTSGEFLRGVVKYSGRVSTGGTIAGTGTDAAQGHWGAVGVDAAFLIAPNALSLPKSFDAIQGPGDSFSNALQIGDRGAERSASDFTQIQDYKILQEMGIEDAKGLAFPHGEPPPSLRNLDLNNPAAVRAAVDQTLQTANRASATALHLGRPVANLFDNLVSDPVQDGIKHHYHLEPTGG
jgi:hypothetical protein